MKVIALLAVRNESLYIKRCLEHLEKQDVHVCLLDNDSTDDTLSIAKSFLERNIVRIERVPYRGSFELARILKREEELSRELDADWFIHHDADEIRESPYAGLTLQQALERADKAGSTAVNFDEFVFLPCREDEQGFEGSDYVSTMRYYYFFDQGRGPRRLNAWKKGLTVDLISSGGHCLSMPDMRLHPDNFILRHYVALSREHLIAKYAGRVYSQEEIDKKGWHRKRAAFSADKMILPSRNELRLFNSDTGFDRSAPWPAHTFLG